MIGTTEILIISGVILLLFGATAIPKFARSLGRARREFEDGLKDGMRETPDARGEGDTGKPGG